LLLSPFTEREKIETLRGASAPLFNILLSLLLGVGLRDAKRLSLLGGWVWEDKLWGGERAVGEFP